MSINKPKSRLLFSSAASVTALAFIGASVYFRQPSPSGSKIIIDDTKGKITDVVQGNRNGNSGVTLQIARGSHDRNVVPDTPKPLDIPTAKAHARNGGFDGAKFLIDYYQRRQDDLLNPPGSGEYIPEEKRDREKERTEWKQRHRDILNELGISEEEYQLFKNAVEFQSRMDILEDNKGKLTAIAREHDEGRVSLVGGGDPMPVISSLQLSGLLRLLCTQAAGSGAYDPIFLNLIGKSEQELQDFALGLYVYFLDKPGARADYLPYLRQEYGFAVDEE